MQENKESFWKRLNTWWISKTSLEENIMTADAAYAKSTYGETMNAQTLIKTHQQRINALIETKTKTNSDNGSAFVDYFCICSFAKDAVPYIKEILEPFRNNGYTVINLSEIVEEYKNYNVYGISWCNSNI